MPHIQDYQKAAHKNPTRGNNNNTLNNTHKKFCLQGIARRLLPLNDTLNAIELSVHILQ